MKYVNVPQSITAGEIMANHYYFAPSKYSAFYPQDRSRFEILSRLVKVKNDREVIKDDHKYRYIEIGDIDVNTGGIDCKEIFGTHVPNKRPFKISKGDILVSTVRTYRKGIGYINSSANNIVSTTAFLVFNRLKKGLTAEYLLAILRSNFFIEQILSFQNRGMYPRLDGETIDSVYIPLPTKRQLNYLTILQRSLINKQEELKRKHNKILEIIEEELLNNQKKNSFLYKQPCISELEKSARFDAGYYCESYKKKQFLLENYIYSAKPIEGKNGWGYEIKRGQNLQESAIGKIIESDEAKLGFYKLIRPTNFSDLGTISNYSYLGSPNQLSTLEPGDIVFSGEGTVGKCVLFVNPRDKAITNIHGIVLNKKDHNIEESSYVACFLRFLRNWGIFEYISVGGQGGSLAMQYWKDVKIPIFPISKQKEIAKLYCKDINFQLADSNRLASFLEMDCKWNKEAGIIQIDEMTKKIQKEVDCVVDQVISGIEITSTLNFL